MPTALDELLAQAALQAIAIEVGTRGIGDAHLRQYLTLALPPATRSVEEVTHFIAQLADEMRDLRLRSYAQ